MEELKDYEVVKELLEDLRNREEQTAEKQNQTRSLIADIPQLPGRESAYGKPN